MKPAKDGQVNDDDGGTINHNNNVGQWTRILTPPPHPPPRCAHSAVCHNDAIYIFGGECATSEKYHHYRDLWKFDIKNNTWEECRSVGGGGTGPPQARSGHRCLVWRHYMILFGGFHESAKNGDTRFFNDLHVYDFQSMTWTELKYGKLARLPPPRSACNLALMSTGSSSEGDALFVYGGYSKVRNASNIHSNGNSSGNINGRQQQHHGLCKSSEGIVHVDCWFLPLKSLLGGIAAGGGAPIPPSPTWERITRKGEYPSGRAGTSSVVFQKNKMVVFGGVMDDEGDHHTMISTFFDDLFAFDMERRRWFAMGLKEKKDIGGVGRRRRKKDAAVGAGLGCVMMSAEIDNGDGHSDDFEEENCAIPIKNEEVKSNGWGLDQLRHNMFVVTDGDGNVMFENVGGVNVDDKEEGMTSAAQPFVQSVENADVSRNFDDLTAKNSDRIPTLNGMISSLSVTKGGHNGLPVAVARETPLPRINCALVVRNNVLYVLGGLLEVGEREVSQLLALFLLSLYIISYLLIFQPSNILDHS
jgi:hypothetical protein